MRVRTGLAMAVAALMLASCAVNPGGATNPASPTSTASPIGGGAQTYDLGTPGKAVSVTPDVRFYPACGNETVAIDGVRWYQFDPSNPDDYPDPTLDILPMIEGWPGMGSSLPRVIAPGPGDDVGTLVVYENDLAYWVSDSHDLDTWLTTRVIDYNWVC